MYHIVALSGLEKGTKFPINSASVSLGRSPENDIVLSDSSVSRRHATLTQRGDTFFIRDLGSTHGLFINGIALQEETELHVNDHLRLGNTEVRFVCDAPEDASPENSSPNAFFIPPGSDDLIDGNKTIAFRLSSDPSAVSQAKLSSHHLALLARAANAIQSVFDTDKLLNTLMDMLFETFKPDRGAILLYENGDLTLTPRVQRPIGETLIISQTVVRHATHHRMALLISDIASDSRFNASQSIMVQSIQSTICAPLVCANQVLGVIYLDARTRQLNYQKEDLALLNVLAVNAAIAIENARLVKEKVESERLAAIGVAVAGISHYIKNILTGIKGTSYLIDLGVSSDDIGVIKEAWPVLQRSTGKISDLVQGMLSYSKKRQPAWEQGNLNSLMQDVFENQKLRAEAIGVNLLLESDPALPDSEFDQLALHDTLLNLVSNAVDACEGKSGASIVLRTGRDAESGMLYACVVDNGPGIPDDVQKKIFEPFFSTKGSKGTGLGLAIARKSAEEHGGRLLLKSEEGKGAAFTVLLPIQRPRV
ncbi:TPA: hypothetical protein DDW35_00525 [Candidatus Sumerlaeota bacterium]|jgi:two-component system, NtrC family, sensor kinase|nr:hypothetical protein [Candidatus Sumerlaeota bacterium]